MSGFEPTEAQTGVGYNMFTLIDPDAIPYPETDTWSLNYAAETIRSGGQEMASTTEDMETTWQGLQEHYTAPESETLFAAVEPVVTAGEDLRGDLDTVATALETFAEAAGEARRKLNNLRMEAQSFASGLEDRKFWWLDRNEEDDEWAIQTNFSLKTEVNRAWSDFTTAEIDCANAISGTHSDVVFTDPGSATGGDNELVYGESGQFIDVGDGSYSSIFFGTLAWQLDNLTEWAAEEFHPAGVEFENSSAQAAWDTLVVGLGFGMVQGLATKSGYWRPETGWAANSDQYGDNLETTWKETGMEAASLVGIHNEDGWLLQPSSDDPYANLSWDWWWGNIEESGRELREGHTAWSKREDDPEYHGTYTSINTGLLFVGGAKIIGNLIGFDGPGSGGGSGGGSDGTPSEAGSGANPFGGQGGAPRSGGSDREIGDIAEESRTPITERLDGALEQTPVLPPVTPEGPGAAGGPGGPSEPGGPGAPGSGPRQDPPNQGTGTQEGPRQDPTSPGAPPPGGTSGSGTGGTEGRGDERGGTPSPGPREGDQGRRDDGTRERPRDDDRRGDGITPPPATGSGGDTPGDGRGSGTQDREGRGGTESSTRPRDDQERPGSPTGQRGDDNRSGDEQRGGTNRDGEQRGRHDEDRKGPEAATGGGGSDRGGDSPPPTSPGDESGQGGRGDDGRGDGSDDPNNIDPYSITPSDYLPGGNLRASESDGYDGRGHTLERHVDVDDDYLRQRTTGDIPNAGRPTRVAGRFNDIETAERAVSMAMHMERERIRDWISEDPPSRRLALHKIDVGMGEIGHALRREGSVKHPTGWTQIKPRFINVVLDRDPSLPPENFRIQTAYPRP